MRRKRWLTVAMIVTAAVAVMMAATSYKEIGKKLEMRVRNQQTCMLPGRASDRTAKETEKNKKKSTKVSEKETQAGESTETEASTAKTETSDTEMASETEKENGNKRDRNPDFSRCRSVKAGPEIKAEKDRDQGRRCV